jgi:hypothetical protein
MASGCITAPATRAQYPNPSHAQQIAVNMYATRPAMSFLEAAAKRIALFNRLKCMTGRIEKRIASENPIATLVMCGLP